MTAFQRLFKWLQCFQTNGITITHQWKLRLRSRARGWGGHAKFDKTDPPLQPPALPSEDLSRCALLAKSHSREEARRSVPVEREPDRVIARVPLHPAWTSCPDARSSHRFELHHDPVRLPGLTRVRRLNRAGHFQGEGREAERSGTPSDGRDGR